MLVGPSPVSDWPEQMFPADGDTAGQHLTQRTQRPVHLSTVDRDTAGHTFDYTHTDCTSSWQTNSTSISSTTTSTDTKYMIEIVYRTHSTHISHRTHRTQRAHRTYITNMTKKHKTQKSDRTHNVTGCHEYFAIEIYSIIYRYIHCFNQISFDFFFNTNIFLQYIKS